MNHRCAHVLGRGPTALDITSAIAAGEARAYAAGHKWTEPRQRVWELLVTAGRPVKAYELMADFRGARRPANPPTVYRALEALEALGLVHRIASMNAYVACGQQEQHGSVAFLICDCCGATAEIEPPKAVLRQAAAAHGFAFHASTLDVYGACANCQQGSESGLTGGGL